MIETAISKNIWNLKYRYNGEEEIDFYNRPVRGLFDGLTTKEEIQPYFSILDMNTREDMYSDLSNVFIGHYGMLAGRPMYSLGTGRTKQTLSNCFVLNFKSDSMEAIMDTAKNSAMTMKAGGGVGYSFSILRPKKYIINSSGARSTGVLSFMNIFNTTCATIEAGGNRRGAQIAVLGVWHPDVMEFITCKRKGDGLPDEYKPYKNFNLSVYISDLFMNAVRDDTMWDLKFPDTTHPKYDDEWDGNINLWEDKGYTVIVHDTIKARDLWDKIMKSSYDFAEPGILFEDTINKNNTLWMEEYILACNPCSEQALPADGSCNLGSLNLTQYVQNIFTNNAHIDFDLLKHITTKMIIMLDRMLDVNYYPLERQAISAASKRQIGLGVTGLGDMLAMMTIKYSSPAGRELVADIMVAIRDAAYRASIELARQLGPFPLWDTFTPEKKKQFIEGGFIKTLPEDIKQDILKYGIRNSRLLSIAPTGTISLIMNNVSSGIEPIFLLEYDRKVKTTSEETISESIETYSWLKYKQFTELNNPEKPDFFETTDDLNVDDHLNMLAVIQRHICTSASKTINIPVDYEYDRYKEVFTKAHSLGIKGCTAYRPNDIIGSVLSKKGGNGPCSERPEEIAFMCAPKRPLDLDCEIHHCNIKGKPWLVIVGMYKEIPYEIFAGEADDLYIPKTCKEGVISKRKKGSYSLSVKIRNSEIEYKDIAHTLMTTEQRAMTRLVSLSLRHGVPHEFVVKQLSKSSGDITDFCAVITRVLKSYIKQYKYDKDVKCPECEDGMLIRKEGCMSCDKQCGYSKCG